MKINKLKSLDLALIKKTLSEMYPHTSEIFDITKSEKLFSPYHIELPLSYLEKIRSFNKVVNKIVNFKFNSLKKGELKLRSEFYNTTSFSTFSEKPQILSCLDFHIDMKTEDIKLIEANTNASGYLIGSLAFALHGLDFSLSFENLLKMFKEGCVWDQDKVFIIDEQPQQQKMFLEFLLYQEFFKKHKKHFEILSIEILDQTLDSLLTENKSLGIYNRSTDFYLENYNLLRNAYLSQTVSLNPDPVGYDLLAHKDNLQEWAEIQNTALNGVLSATEIVTLQSFLLPSKPMQTLFEDKEIAWKERKKFFFKPVDSYGGKATYKGSSISKKYFQSAWDENFLAQSYFPAPHFSDEDGLDWKFDLRVFVFKEEILYSLARVYQGQITNFSQLGGGFAPVTYSGEFL